MIEVAILDNTEKLLAAVPPYPIPASGPMAFQITGCQSALLSSGDSTVASSLAQSLATISAGAASFPSPDFSKVWTSAYAGTYPSNKTMLFDVAAETITFDDSGARGLTQIITDNVGTVWAQSSVSFGLWKRTGAATWTQVLSDSGVATGVRYRASDNTYWYQSTTSNHYQLANGAATLQSAPSGTLFALPAAGWQHLDAPYVTALNFNAAATAVNGDGTANSSITSPLDAFANYLSIGPISMYQVRIDATYSLLWGTLQSGTYPYYYLYLFNKVSGVVRYIGHVPPVAIKGGVAPTAAHMSPFAAKWVGRFLRVYFRGSTVSYTTVATAGNQGGIVRVDIPYQPNF